MKIGFLIKDLSSGGAERATVSLANYFALRGNSVDIITFKGTDSFYPLEDEVKVHPADLGEIEQSASFKRLFGSIGRMIKIRKLVKSLELDVLIGMSFAMTWYTVLATLFTKTKSVGTERSNPYRYKASKINTFLRKLFYYFTDGYVFQTRRAAGFFGGKKSDQDIIIPNAIFNETVYSLSPPAERKKIICATGRLIKLKRFDMLIDSFASIADQIPEYTLFIFGEGEEKDALQGQIDSLGLGKRIILAGTDPQAVKFVNHASVFVLSSDFEGMPNALLEALAMGVPCVSTRCEMGPDELIEDGESGILIDVGNGEQLSQAMLRIIKDPEFSRKLSENGRKLLKTHSIESISRQWLDYLNRI